MTHSINLDTVTFEAYCKVLELDKSFVGTPNYMGVAYFWHFEFRHYLRDASMHQRKQIHKKWLEEGLGLTDVSEAHYRVIQRVMKLTDAEVGLSIKDMGAAA